MRKILSLFPVLMLLCIFAFGQSRPVTGRISDEKGDPIPFATITEVGTRNATTADANGIFTINVGPSARLAVSAAGHQTQTLTASTGTLNFTLGNANAQMQEVIVTSLGVRREA